MENKYFEFKQLLSSPIKRAAYSDRTAWLMAKMSKLAYLPFEIDDSELKIALAEADFVVVKCFNNDGTQAFLARRESDKMAILSFRGTQVEGFTLETFFDAFADLYATMHIGDNNIKTHKGFLLAFQKIQTEVVQQVQVLPDYSLYITGHSLGGALALIAMSEIVLDNLGACYTFGSPKVGNEEFDDKIKSPIYRVINSYDVVPFLPFTTIMLPLFWMIKKKIKNDKVKILIENFKEYRHHGDMRFLTNVISNKDAKVLNEYGELKRSIHLLRLSFIDKDTGVQHHSIDAYCEKLAHWALKRV